MNNLDLEKLYKVTREEFGENVDAVLEKVKETSPILIRSEGEPDLLLFDYEHYMEFGSTEKREGTLKKQHSIWKNHDEPTFGDRPLVSIGVGELKNYLIQLL